MIKYKKQKLYFFTISILYSYYIYSFVLKIGCIKDIKYFHFNKINSVILFVHKLNVEHLFITVIVLFVGYITSIYCIFYFFNDPLINNFFTYINIFLLSMVFLLGATNFLSILIY